MKQANGTGGLPHILWLDNYGDPPYSAVVDHHATCRMFYVADYSNNIAIIMCVDSILKKFFLICKIIFLGVIGIQ